MIDDRVQATLVRFMLPTAVLSAVVPHAVVPQTLRDLLGSLMTGSHFSAASSKPEQHVRSLVIECDFEFEQDLSAADESPGSGDETTRAEASRDETLEEGSSSLCADEKLKRERVGVLRRLAAVQLVESVEVECDVTMTHDLIEGIASLPGITSFEMQYVNTPSDQKCLEPLASLHQLKRAFIAANNELLITDLPILSWHKLEKLELENVEMHVFGMNHIAALQSLTSLSVSWCHGVGSAALHALQPAGKRLRHLDLGKACATEGSLIELCEHLEVLEYLDVSACRFSTAACMTAYGAMRSLRTLSAGNSPAVSIEGIMNLTAAQRNMRQKVAAEQSRAARTLAVKTMTTSSDETAPPHCPVHATTGDAVAFERNGLRELTLSTCDKLDRNHVPALSALLTEAPIKRLAIPRCPLSSDSEVDTLRAQHPGVIIHTNPF